MIIKGSGLDDSFSFGFITGSIIRPIAQWLGDLVRIIYSIIFIFLLFAIFICWSIYDSIYEYRKLKKEK